MKLLSKIRRIIAGQQTPENWREAKEILESEEYKNWLEKRLAELDQVISNRISQHRDFSLLQQEKVEILSELARVKAQKSEIN